jgi:hypothetical protein
VSESSDSDDLAHIVEQSISINRQKALDKTHCDTDKNMMESNAELAALLKKKLATMKSKYILVRESPRLTPKTLKLMKNKMTAAKNDRMLSLHCHPCRRL